MLLACGYFAYDHMTTDFSFSFNDLVVLHLILAACRCNMAPQRLRCVGSASTSAKCLPLTLRATFLILFCSALQPAAADTTASHPSLPGVSLASLHFNRVHQTHHCELQGHLAAAAAAAETASLFGCVVFEGNIHECL